MSPTSNRPTLELLRSLWPALRVTTAAFAFILWEVAFSSVATAQVVPKAKDDKPPVIDKRPLARYVPKDNLLLLIESDGLEANGEAWKKTAAYRLLNETTLGEMLEAMLTQLADRLLTFSPVQKLSGADITRLIKHAANHGFLLAVVGDEKSPKPSTHSLVVFRGGYAVRESRPAFSRLMGTMMGPSRFASVKKGTRTVAQVTPAGGVPWVWWPEQGDLVIAENVEAVIATIDGKTPNAIDHPLRSALVKTDSGFTPFGVILVDPSAAGQAKSETVAKIENALSEWGVTRLEFRWGAQDEALMNVTRLQAAKPRKGLLAVVDQPTFDRTKMLPLPASIESYSAFSMDSKTVFDAVLPSLPSLPPQAGALSEGIVSLESKSRVDLRKDILGRIGPRMVSYVMPGTAPARPASETTAKPEPNPLSGMIGIPLPGMGSYVFPRYTLLAEVKDHDGLEADLDKLMVAVNKELKAKAVEAEKAMEAAGRTPGGAGPFGGGGRGGPGNLGGPGGRRPPPPIVAPEFKLMPGKEKAYALSMPADQVKQLPAGFRPTVRLGEKYFVIAANPEAARLALEAKEDGYVPPSDVASSLDRLPKQLVYLNVHDPRGTEPELLSALPGTVQGLVNVVLSMLPPPATAVAAATPNAGAPAGTPPGFAPGGAANEGGGRRGGGKRGEEFPGPGAGASGPPGGAGFAGAPPGFAQGASGPLGANPGAMMGAGPGGPAGAKKPDAKVTPFYFDIESSLLPTADEIKTRLFPMVWAISADDKEVVIQGRGAFPNPVTKETLTGLTLGIPLGNALRQGEMPPGSPPGPFAGPGGIPPQQGQGRPPAVAPGRGEGGGGAKRAEQ